MRHCSRLALGAFAVGWMGAAACTAPQKTPAGRAFPASTNPQGRGSVPVVGKGSVVAFWLAAADTIPTAARNRARDEFRESNAGIARYLADTDIGLVATVNDTVVIQLPGGFRRTVMLNGLDFPYGYLLIEPGFAEEFHTGIEPEADLEGAIDDYFGFDDDSLAPKHRIAQTQAGESVPTYRPTNLPTYLVPPHDTVGPQYPQVDRHRPRSRHAALAGVRRRHAASDGNGDSSRESSRRSGRHALAG